MSQAVVGVMKSIECEVGQRPDASLASGEVDEPDLNLEDSPAPDVPVLSEEVDDEYKLTLSFSSEDFLESWRIAMVENSCEIEWHRVNLDDDSDTQLLIEEHTSGETYFARYTLETLDEGITQLSTEVLQATGADDCFGPSTNSRVWYIEASSGAVYLDGQLQDQVGLFKAIEQQTDEEEAVEVAES